MKTEIIPKEEQAIALRKRQSELLRVYSPVNCFKHSHKLRTVKDVLERDSISLGRMMREVGREWVLAYITLWVIDLNENAQVKTKMSDASIEFVAERIYENYPLKVTDLTLFFRNVKEGVYGTYYENLSSEKIMEWLSQYFDLRCEYAQMYSQSGHIKLIKGANRKLTDEEKRNFKENMDRVFQGVGEKKVDHSKKGRGLGSRQRLNKNELYSFAESQSVEQLLNYLEHEKDTKNEWVKESLVEVHRSLKNRMPQYIENLTMEFDRQMLEDLINDWGRDPQRKPYVRLLKAKRKIIK